MYKKHAVLCLTALLCLQLNAQENLRIFAQRPDLSAGNYVAYPTPTKALTPPPPGYKACYLSHYGRHGSRFLIDEADYTGPLHILQQADSLGKLTAKGKDLLSKFKLIAAEAKDRYGELTLRGAQQHREIAERMYRNFPEIFSDTAHVDARSTIIVRCILSMQNALHQLIRHNPHLKIAHDASHHDMYFMNQTDTVLKHRKMPEEVKNAFDRYAQGITHPQRVMALIFNDTAYVRQNLDVVKFYDRLFKVASNVQSTELRHRISLYDLFSPRECYEHWLKKNVWWYINYGPSPLNGGTQPFSQRNLVRDIIHRADSCLRLLVPGATLRYGHDTMVLPLVCLLQLNGFDKQVRGLDEVKKIKWYDHLIIPMAANVQFVFYRRSISDKQILFKVLLNEQEATLPIPAFKGPYYRWQDFKSFMLQKIENYEGDWK